MSVNAVVKQEEGAVDAVEWGRGRVEAMEAAIRALPAELQLFPKSEHWFAPGIYLREFHVGKGMVVVGKVHKEPNLLVVISGDMDISEDGNPPERVGSGYIELSKAGSRRLLFGHEHTVIITIHPRSDEETVEELEARIFCDGYDEFEGGKA